MCQDITRLYSGTFRSTCVQVKICFPFRKTSSKHYTNFWLSFDFYFLLKEKPEKNTIFFLLKFFWTHSFLPWCEGMFWYKLSCADFGRHADILFTARTINTQYPACIFAKLLQRENCYFTTSRQVLQKEGVQSFIFVHLKLQTSVILFYHEACKF